MKDFTIDSTDCQTLEKLHERIAVAFGFPPHYGKNLDALWDCLGEIERPCKVTWLRYDETAKRITEASAVFDVILEFSRAHRDFLFQPK